MANIMTQHKQLRMNRRKEWKRVKNLERIEIEKGIHYQKPKSYQKLKKYEQRKRRRLSQLHLNESRSFHNHNRTIITIEKNFNFEENIENIVKFTNDIDDYLSLSLNKSFSIDHKKIQDISIGGLLYLVGQISKITTAKFNDGKHHLKYNRRMGLSDDERIKYLFNEIGYWQYFGIKNPYRVTDTMKDTYFLSIETSQKSDFNLLNKIKSFINERVDFIKQDYGIEYQFDDAIKEAMGNSIEHAYHDDFSEVGKRKGKWWICGHYDKKRESLEIAFYDYGIGIRESINYNLGEEADKFFFDLLKEKTITSDADLIETAIEGDLAKYKRYKDHDRGKGFKRFKKFAKVSANNCELTIVSSKGRYKFCYNAETETEKVEKKTLSAPIDGMLIKWVINLSERNEDG